MHTQVKKECNGCNPEDMGCQILYNIKMTLNAKIKYFSALQ